MDIRMRRFTPYDRPFMYAVIVWTKTDDGRVYARSEGIAREFVSDVLRDHGVGAIRRFWCALKEELSVGLVDPENFIPFEGYRLEFTGRGRTYERMCEMLGVEPKRRIA